MIRCPGSGLWPGPPLTWRAGFGVRRAHDDRVTCPACGRRYAPRADGLTRAHLVPDEVPRRITQK
jgi:hypothetical protein